VGLQKGSKPGMPDCDNDAAVRDLAYVLQQLEQGTTEDLFLWLFRSLRFLTEYRMLTDRKQEGAAS
jgi:hypothetical protein